MSKIFTEKELDVAVEAEIKARGGCFLDCPLCSRATDTESPYQIQEAWHRSKLSVDASHDECDGQTHDHDGCWGCHCRDVSVLRQELAKARRLLVDLRDLQNGPPLITEEVGWEKTMLAINVFLARTDKETP